MQAKRLFAVPTRWFSMNFHMITVSVNCLGKLRVKTFCNNALGSTRGHTNNKKQKHTRLVRYYTVEDSDTNTTEDI